MSQLLRIDLATLRETATVSDVLGAYGRHLPPGRRRGPCPVCEATSGDPFSTRDEGRYWRCFACNRGGSAIDLEAALGGASLMDAARTLAGRLGMAPSAPGDLERAGIERRRRAASAAMSASLERGRAQLAAAVVERTARLVSAVAGMTPAPLALDVALGAHEAAEWAREAEAPPAPRPPLAGDAALARAR